MIFSSMMEVKLILPGLLMNLKFMDHLLLLGYNLKDFADVGLEIKSNYMINFICEFFDCQPANMRIAYLRQRLLVMIFREVLFEKGIVSKREGDDIFVENRKLSISIASASLSSMKIHFALNLEDNGTPDDVETIGLFDIKQG